MSQTTKFHTESFKLMGISPVYSPHRLQLIAEREREINRTLPPALKELYAVEGVEEWFENGNGDQLVPLQRIELETREYWELELGLTFLNLPDNMKANEGIYFFIECQGCWSWWVLLNGTEDPPVIVESLYDEAQILACEKLSDFIFANAWDVSLMDSPSFQAGEYPCEEAFLQILRDQCVDKPTTRLASTIHRYRFGYQGCRLLLFEETGQLFMSADHEEAKNELMELINPFVQWDRV
ncbi:hypothetical protein [Laceyella sacchari]|uniref:SMI1/KNR4 family protein n=1 Tax=Laceyella sacchari TaxID=37482 RepID=A0ABY5U5H8_LACSH|nr:hypothetical protein [Laceyella sacchari]UWE04876.1 hypothetical protein NYR52_07080 [Laceyella sacchari]